MRRLGPDFVVSLLLRLRPLLSVPCVEVLVTWHRVSFLFTKLYQRRRLGGPTQAFWAGRQRDGCSPLPVARLQILSLTR